MKPILFSTPMVQAILDGRKTMRRRVIRPQPQHAYDDYMGGWDCLTEGHCHLCEPKPPYKPGDILWVRETWYQHYDGSYAYRASAPENTGWKPSIHMPREAARIFLRVKTVRVERLQDITEEDAKAEGVICGQGQKRWTARSAFMDLWDRINGKKNPWESNPWVWVISFERISEQEAKEHDRS